MSNLGLKYQRRKYRYFFVDDELHKLIAVNRGHDEALAWNYPNHKRVMYSWSEIKRKGLPGYTLTDAAKVLDRSPTQLRKYWAWGEAARPPRTYSLTTGNPGFYILSEKHIMELHEALSNRHFGRPRTDKLINVRRVPDQREINAFVKHDILLYARNKDGEMIPVYAAEDW